MLFSESKVKVSDNSGAKLVKIVKVPGSSKPRTAKAGDIVLVTTRQVKFKHKLKASKRILKGMLFKAIIMRTKKPEFFRDGTFVKFDENKVVLIQKTQPRTFGGPKLAGNRVFGPIVLKKKLKKKFPKLFALASLVITSRE